MKHFINDIKDHPFIHLALLTFMVVVVYVNTLGNQFVWDDETFVNWPMIRSFANIKFFLQGILPIEHFGDYRPLKGIFLAVDYALFKVNPTGYHVTAILVHLATTFAVYILTRELVRQHLGRGVGAIAFMTSVLFAVHPIHTEAITFVTSSSDVIGVTFLLFSIYFYIRGVRGLGDRMQIILSCVFAVFAYIAYEMTLVLPFLLILYDFCFGRLKQSNWVRLSKTYLSYFILIAGYAFIRFGILKVSEAGDYPGHNIFLTMLTMVKVFAQYILLVIWPHKLTVAHEISPGVYALAQGDFNPIAFASQKITDWQFIFSLGTILVPVILAFILYKKYPFVTFCILWFFLSLAPVSNIVPISSLMSERYLYQASYGFCLLAGWLFYKISTKKHFLKYFTVCFFIGLTTIYSLIAIMRNFEWRDGFSLWTATHKLSPTSALANYNLAISYQERGEPDIAFTYYKTAYEHNGNKLARFPIQMGELAAAKDDPEKAIEYFREAKNSANSNFEKFYSEARIYHLSKQESLAIEAYKRAILANPEFTNPHIYLGVLYAKLKKWDKAVYEFKLAQALDPKLMLTYINLASIYEKMNNYKEAIDQLERAAILFPGNTQVQSGLDKLKAQTKQL